jgi:glycolate oxidase FAD binding subunit
MEELQDAVRSTERVRVRGAGTKTALSRDATVSTSKLSGILEYEPSEYTFTALAGTPIVDIQTVLAEHGQFLIFDPPLAEAGATLGGTVSAGLSGPGRFRFGGVRDFILGVRMVTGDARIVFGGGKVVKNAAGFDIPKLVTGALGRMGVLVELTFKVFPAPETWTTIRADFAELAPTVDALHRLAVAQEDLFCLDLEPPHRLWVRLGGLADAQPARVERVRRLIADATVEVLTGEDDAQVWSDAREFRWLPEEHSLIKMPITSGQLPDVETALSGFFDHLPCRYSVGGNVVWIGWPDSLESTELNRLCQRLNRSIMILTGERSEVLRGSRGGLPFRQRLLNVFDPQSKFSSK